MRLKSEEHLNKTLAKLCNKLIIVAEQFDPKLDYSDRIWKFYLQLKRKWVLFGMQKYKETYYFFGSNFESFGFEPKTGALQDLKWEQDLEKILPAVLGSLQGVRKAVHADFVRYGSKLAQTLPPEFRKGLIHRRFVRELIPDFARFDKELGKRELKRMLEYLQTYENSLMSEKEMTASRYFEYCRVAYLANKETTMKGIDQKMDGREMFRRYADGRDGGLKEIDQESPEAFARWSKDRHSQMSGDHPWEIYRGGNTTHINLYVTESHDGGWKVGLEAYSSSRLAETCRIALALRDAGLPFVLEHRESYLSRLLCDDLVGVIPEHDSVHRGWQRFPAEFKVADCIQFNWFKDDQTGKWPRPKKEIARLISWLPERPVLVRE